MHPHNKQQNIPPFSDGALSRASREPAPDVTACGGCSGRTHTHAVPTPVVRFWESAAPYGTLPTCLTTVPSHTHAVPTPVAATAIGPTCGLAPQPHGAPGLLLPQHHLPPVATPTSPQTKQTPRATRHRTASPCLPGPCLRCPAEPPPLYKLQFFMQISRAHTHALVHPQALSGPPPVTMGRGTCHPPPRRCQPHAPQHTANSTQHRASEPASFHAATPKPIAYGAVGYNPPVPHTDGKHVLWLLLLLLLLSSS